ncbi:MAG: sulfatase-like hydrolase/transferase [Acidobacteriota bacterium]
MSILAGMFPVIILSCLEVTVAAAPASDRPNILFAIADDWSYGYASAYGSDWVNTPGFDRVAGEGILFTRAYTPNAKCAPSRASILTGRNSWQLKEAANHICFFPPEFKTFAEALAGHGYFVGKTGKGWGPGVANDSRGRQRAMTGRPFDERKLQPPAGGIASNDYAGNFEDFLSAKPEGDPWFFWYGALEPHREYEYGSGVARGGKEISDIDRVPGFWPDNEVIRNDMLDYAYEVEHFDRHLLRMLETLEERGQLENTLVIITSDHGMPFPRVKGQAYDSSNHIPLAMMWKAGIKKTGRVVDDYVSLIDLAPTFIELAGLEWGETGMQPSEGDSLTVILFSNKSGQINPQRDHVLIGKERHDIGRPHDWGYPIRGIVKGDMLYIHNFETSRWPAGNPETGYLNCDGSPTKTAILETRTDPNQKHFWQSSFGKRPQEELYDLRKDPDCLINLAGEAGYGALKQQLKHQLFGELKAQKDPRMFGNGHVFENYPYSDEKFRHFYERFMSGEELKPGWVNPSDFEEKPLALEFTRKLLYLDPNEGCAIADVNNDGRPDVIAGRNWYAAPDFVPRPLRQIGEWNGYLENNGEHAYDVNGDGWVDVISGSFLPTEVYWYENPGPEGLQKGFLWKQHLLQDTQATQNEITFMHDLDGDGVPEWVVNSWNKKAPTLAWKLSRDETGRPALKKIIIGEQGNGHGMGFGDINGDGLEDILVGTGWYQRPQGDALGGPWTYHPDWDIHASCPMLVQDLDGDGRNDLIWGAGHDFGLFWWKQQEPGPDGRTHWEEHLIDKEYSQTHCLVWVDLDGDGQADLLTGKRKWAHNGKDPGGTDPPGLYYYTWDRELLSFTRHVIDRGSVGTGLQLRTADLDGDGHIDIVSSGKSGTYVLFNQGLPPSP